MVAVLAYGFLARVAAGPTLSPLGQIATRLVAPRLGPPKLVAGPPKRFAQAIGAVLTTVGTFLFFGLHQATGTYLLLGLLAAAASLESALGFCVGCRLFAALIRLGWIPESTCEACQDIWSRTA